MGSQKSWTRVRDLGKEMAIHPSTTAWKIPWTEEPGHSNKDPAQPITKKVNSINTLGERFKFLMKFDMKY